MRQHFLVHDSHIQCIVIGQEVIINYDKQILQEHFFFSPAFVTCDSVFDGDTDDAEVQVLFLPLVTCQSYLSPHVPNHFHEKSVELLVKKTLHALFNKSFQRISDLLALTDFPSKES